jgi:hypothetical protein
LLWLDKYIRLAILHLLRMVGDHALPILTRLFSKMFQRYRHF